MFSNEEGERFRQQWSTPEAIPHLDTGIATLEQRIQNANARYGSYKYPTQDDYIRNRQENDINNAYLEILKSLKPRPLGAIDSGINAFTKENLSNEQLQNQIDYLKKSYNEHFQPEYKYDLEAHENELMKRQGIDVAANRERERVEERHRLQREEEGIRQQILGENLPNQGAQQPNQPIRVINHPIQHMYNIAEAQALAPYALEQLMNPGASPILGHAPPPRRDISGNILAHFAPEIYSFEDLQNIGGGHGNGA
jgi:hypothetical protein